MISPRTITETSQAEHARLRALHGEQFADLVEPWIGLLEMRAAARGHGSDIVRVAMGLIGDAHALGLMDRPHVGWILAALEERCEQERIGTVMLYEAQDEGCKAEAQA